jgi:hypothetical protein
MKEMTCFGLLLLFVLIAPNTRAAVENRTSPGELVIDPPTLINLGFEWMIEGDDNRSAKVEVSYRRQGETQWKQGLPLLRLQGEEIYQGQGVFDVVSPNMCLQGAAFSIWSPIRRTKPDSSSRMPTAFLAMPETFSPRL